MKTIVSNSPTNSSKIYIVVLEKEDKTRFPQCLGNYFMFTEQIFPYIGDKEREKAKLWLYSKIFIFSLREIDIEEYILDELKDLLDIDRASLMRAEIIGDHGLDRMLSGTTDLESKRFKNYISKIVNPLVKKALLSRSDRRDKNERRISYLERTVSYLVEEVNFLKKKLASVVSLE